MSCCRPTGLARRLWAHYSEDANLTLEPLVLRPARQLTDASCVVAGSKYPTQLAGPPSETVLAPATMRARNFYRPALGVERTRSDMKAPGLFPERAPGRGAACGYPLISDD